MAGKAADMPVTIRSSGLTATDDELIAAEIRSQ
jgi:hypothetical protein